MTNYCKTMTEIDGQRWYGIDLVSSVDHIVLLSVKAVTTDWKHICWIVNWLNWVELPPTLFEEFAEAVGD